MSDAADLRLSDQERERAVEELREHTAAGQDLHSLPVSPAQRKAELAERRGELQRRLAQEAGGGVIVFGACAAIWAAAGASGSFWPIWIALACLLPLLRTAWLLFGPAPDFEQVEQDLARYRRWNERHDAPLERARQRRHDVRRQRREGRRLR